MTTTTPLLSIYDGRQIIGFVLERGRSGFEAYDAGEKSLGVFETQDAAVSELMQRMEA